MPQQKYDALIQRLGIHLHMGTIPLEWTGVDAMLPFLEKMRGEGAVVIIKLDGERTAKSDNGPYTVVVSGAPLNGDFCRTDAHSIEDALSQVVIEYARKCWGFEISRS